MFNSSFWLWSPSCLHPYQSLSLLPPIFSVGMGCVFFLLFVVFLSFMTHHNHRVLLVIYWMPSIIDALNGSYFCLAPSCPLLLYHHHSSCFVFYIVVPCRRTSLRFGYCFCRCYCCCCRWWGWWWIYKYDVIVYYFFVFLLLHITHHVALCHWCFCWFFLLISFHESIPLLHHGFYLYYDVPNYYKAKATASSSSISNGPKNIAPANVGSMHDLLSTNNCIRCGTEYRILQ